LAEAAMHRFKQTLTTAFLVAAVGIVFASGAAQAKKFEVLESLGDHEMGSTPQGPVLIDKDGNIFGTASQFGPQGDGTVFELKRVRHGYKASSIFRFNGVNGGYPTGALIMDTQGNLYGTAYDVAFELSPVTGQRLWSEKILHQFCSNGCGDGNQPVGGLTYQGASSGALYDGVSPLFGVTAEGGANNAGTVFQLIDNSGNWTEAVLYNFCSVGGNNCLDGSLPFSGLTVDKTGNLFGAAVQGGGKDQGGTIFELSPNGDSWTFNAIYRFCGEVNCADGESPAGPLVIDAAGSLLGVTGGGGPKCKADKVSSCGTIFKLAFDGANWQETVLYNFCQERDCRDGRAPSAGLTMDSFGNLYGTTADGGGNDIDEYGFGGGIVFQFDGSALNVLHRFCSLPNCADGERPLASVVMDEQGDLYGTTSLGGELGSGTVFEINP
jgi:uncharacterized repeat protein (TIGR03803 family)